MENLPKDWSALTKWSLETYWPTKAPSEHQVPALIFHYEILQEHLKSFSALASLQKWCEGLLVVMRTLDVTSTPLQTILERWPSTDMSATPFIDLTKVVQLETMQSMCVVLAQKFPTSNPPIRVEAGSLPSTSTDPDQLVFMTYKYYSEMT